MADQLERLFRALVHRVRDVRPEHLSRPFEVADLLRTFVPYRATRAEVGVDTAEDYEVLLLRLLSGERGFVFTDDAMQEDLRRELDSGNPDLRALQAYGTAKLTLAQHAMRQVLEASAPAEVAAAAPAAPARAAPVQRDAPIDAPLTSAAAPRMPDASEVTAALDALQRQLPAPAVELGQAVGAASEGRARPAAYQAHASRVPDPTVESVSRSARPGCRFCGQSLPEGREVTFCPHCGQNLKVRRCPGCSAEVDSAWKFCVTCGRAATTG
jgi:hypothetical protein